MAVVTSNRPDDEALTKAAKYVCTLKCGRCPMIVEGFACPTKCSLSTIPWQCWLAYFKTNIQHAQASESGGEVPAGS